MSQGLINHILAGTSHVLQDERVELVLEQLYTRAQLASDEAKANWSPDDPYDAQGLGDWGFSLQPGQGELLHLLCRTIRAQRIITLTVSEGAPAIYCAAAVRDNGGGLVTGTDHRPAHVEAAKANLHEAGLADYATIHCGDVIEALRGVSDPVDLLYIDGWPELSAPSRALQAVTHLKPLLRSGAVVLNAGVEPDYIEYVRNQRNGFRSTILDMGVLSVVD